jgi:hypothetical protein
MLASEVELRRLPYPYRAMLAICSDLDETPDWRAYWEIMRFLNTNEITAMGPGVGLEVGNSIYFDMPPDEFAYWNTDDRGRAMVRALVRSGHIDCLHSYGDLATARRHAGAALDELAQHDCRIEVWIDHRVAPTNFGADIMHGAGDVRGDDAYHADLTCTFGVQYVWRGRVTSVFGQDVPRRLGGIFTARHPFGSTRTLAKEVAKGVLARAGHAKYAMHGPNAVLRRAQLRDGRPVYEFMRSNPYWGGVENADTAAGLAGTLTPQMLDRFAARGGVCVFYTHLGKGVAGDELFDPATRLAFRRLADRFHAGEILVTTTRRLLGYRRAAREVSFTVQDRPDGCLIAVSTRVGNGNGKGLGALAASDLAGLTFYVPDPVRTRMTIDGRAVPNLRQNQADHTGWRSVSLPWPALEFPSL